MNNTCFVIMPIGTQNIGSLQISESDLRKKYDYIIKNAVTKADPSLEVIRADEELNPGSITNDIFTKLMHSKYVIADITYPNPNVFYELGIRHAISLQTILIREKTDFSIPFDISHLRYIEYTQEPDGMDNLTVQLQKSFEFYRKNQGKPDNQFLELCSLTNYSPISYYDSTPTNEDVLSGLMMKCISNPALLQAMTDNSLSPDEQQQIFLSEFSNDPATLKPLLDLMVRTGALKF